ncbi:MAG: DUF47 family protein [Phycisphaerales bacterium]|nr:DUF47 family protein [Phycisphaerae bacterium]NNF44557.1 DUF47 family protein [Phycisphaerales bacterium]NNM26539.1 DUF47 family protein [Phycisphaerales bacterium]
MKLSPFGQTRALTSQIDEFLDQVSESGLVLAQAYERYVEQGVDDSSEQRLQQLIDLEARADQLRRSIQTTMYSEMLIPESRGDVLGLLHELDDLVDRFKASFLTITIEKPEIPVELREDFKSLVESMGQAVDHTVRAARAYFRNYREVRDLVHKVSYFESESDRIAIRLRKAIFASKLPIERKRELREGVLRIERMANAAEDVGDRLTICAIKRSL